MEGLPGAGKTTSAGLLARRLGAAVLRERTPDHPFLESVYDDERRYDFEVELAFLLLHSGAYRRADRERVTVADYSPVKDVLFARDMLAGDDLDLWLRTYGHVYRGVGLPDVAVLIRVPAAECLRRVRERGHEFEQAMTLDRLQRMEALYERHLADLGADVLTFDVALGQGPEQVADELAAVIRREALIL